MTSSSSNHFLPPLPNQSSGRGRVFNVDLLPDGSQQHSSKLEEIAEQPQSAAQFMEQEKNPIPRLSLESLTKVENDQQIEPLLQDKGYFKKVIKEFNISDTTQLVNEGVWPIALDDASAVRSNQLSQLPQSYQQIQNSVENTGSLLVRVITWNQQAKETPSKESIVANLIPSQIFHVIAISTQECENSFTKSMLYPAKTKWEIATSEILGNDYEMIRSHALTASHIAVYVHKAITHLVSEVDSYAIPTGICDTLGNKGGIGISLRIGASSFCFLNAHLAAHQSELNRRTYEFRKISTEIAQKLGNNIENDESELNLLQTINSTRRSIRSKCSPRCCSRKKDFKEDENPLIDAFDFLFWAGDLNFRINGTREIIDGLLHKDRHGILINNEQLKMLMQFDPFFTGLSEGPLNFRPTYKYDKGEDVYDTSIKRRIPAWTDRVLYKNNNDINLISYSSAQQVRSSDHRPVYASFRVNVVGTENCVNSNRVSQTWESVSKSEVCVIS